MGVIDDILAKEPEHRTVEFCTDQQLREALAEAQFELEKARQRADQSRSPDARREVNDLETKVEELLKEAKTKLIRLTFGALDPEHFDELKGQHRPTEKQLTAARKEKAAPPEWNSDTFAPVLVAAACIKVESPSGTADGLSLDDTKAMWASKAYNTAERNEMFNAALAATLTRTRIDVPKGG